MRRNIFSSDKQYKEPHLVSFTSFTLIEILMVFGILSLIVGFVIFRFPASSERARDTKRQSDLKSYQGALELYAMKNSGLYPTSAAQNITNLCTTLGMSGATCASDPSGGTYYYETDSAGLKYALWSGLERSSETYVACSDGKSGLAFVTPAAGACPSFTASAAVCGNGVLDSGEACDDGNTVSGDGCSGDCLTIESSAVCGNMLIESGEVCDDGNTVSGDGCSSNCSSSCGDSDGGARYYISGSVAVTNSSGTTSTADSCTGSTLSERICQPNDTLGLVSSSCSGGCASGKCTFVPFRNSATGLSCAQMCAASPYYLTCFDIGTDSNAINNMYSIHPAYVCTTATGTCSTIMSSDGFSCSYPTRWTMCKCL